MADPEEQEPTPDAREGPPSPRPVSRRDALRRVGGGSLSLLGAGLVVGSVGTHAATHAGAAGAAAVEGDHAAHDVYTPAAGTDRDGVMSRGLPVGDAASPYGGPYAMPDGVAPDALDALTRPPPRRDGPVEVEIDVVERHVQISRDHALPQAWTYGGTVPGPIIRATEGERVRIRFRNQTQHDHNLHLHGRHAPAMDGWEPIPPGGTFTYEVEAGPAGVHPYHCHTMPIDAHIARGLYGAFIVDPPGGRPDAHEVVLVLGGFDVDGDGRNEVYAWNGVAGFYELHPIRVPAGEPVRAYVLNCVEYDPVASFHLHAQTFAVFPSGMGAAPAWSGDVVTLGQMERAILEFTLPEVGRYMFHPHQHAIAHRGAMGWFAAV